MKKLIFFLLIGMAVASCQKTEDNNGLYENGVWIVNEGVFNANNGSVSHYDPVSGTVVNEVFLSENLRPLGDVVQSMAIHGNRAYLVVNNSKKIEVADLKTFRSLHTIQGLDYPRYFLSVDAQTAYLSDGNFAGRIRVIDLASNSITGDIPVGNGPESMLKSGNLVYVANSGGWTYDSTLSIIDVNTQTVVNTVKVGDQPTDLVMDAEGKIWVICQGKIVWNQDYTGIETETPSCLARVNPDNLEVDFFEIGFTGDFFSPKRLAISPDGTTLYYEESGGVYAMDIHAAVPPASPLIPKTPYGLDVDPSSGEIYVMVSGGAESRGTLFRFLPDGTAVDSVETGYFPNGAIFNR